MDSRTKEVLGKIGAEFEARRQRAEKKYQRLVMLVRTGIEDGSSASDIRWALQTIDEAGRTFDQFVGDVAAGGE